MQMAHGRLFSLRATVTVVWWLGSGASSLWGGTIWELNPGKQTRVNSRRRPGALEGNTEEREKETVLGSAERAGRFMIWKYALLRLTRAQDQPSWRPGPQCCPCTLRTGTVFVQPSV